MKHFIKSSWTMFRDFLLLRGDRALIAQAQQDLEEIKRLKAEALQDGMLSPEEFDVYWEKGQKMARCWGIRLEAHRHSDRPGNIPLS